MSDNEDQCCSVDPIQQKRNLARTLDNEAAILIGEKKYELASSLLNAARSLLLEFGGLNGEEAVWLLTSEAHLPLNEDKHEEALPILEEALAIAKRDFAPDHFAIGVCKANLADCLTNLGETDKARKLAKSALKILKAALNANEDDYMDGYLKGCIEEAKRLK